MRVFTDDEVNALLVAGKPYTVVVVKTGPNHTGDAAARLSWEHNRRNFGLHDGGPLSVILRVMDDTDVYGIEVFDATVAETVAVMDDDPAVRAGVFRYEVHPCRGYPGDTLH